MLGPKGRGAPHPRTRAKGEFRWWAFFLANVTMVMPTMKAKKLTAEVAEVACEGLR